jgi:septum formation protein
VLASASPRRQELLSKIGVEFDVLPAAFDESTVSGSPQEVARSLALEKAMAVAHNLRDSLVIGADTIVLIGGQILGKPADEAEARTMLARISGRTHTVITGVALVHTASGRMAVDHEESRVHIRDLSPEEIAAYVRTGEPMDKAGAYAVQGIGSTIVDRIEGCYFNVVGLPMSRLAMMLKQFGVNVLS